MNQHQTYGGFCTRCQKDHFLTNQNTLAHGQKLILELETRKSLVLDDVRFSTNILFGPARGQMFGVMLVRDTSGNTHSLKAFSGQFNGHYLVSGWVPPVFDLDAFHGLNDPEEKRIKALTAQLATTTDPQEQQRIKQERRTRSRELMRHIHQLYILKNFKGDTKPITAFFPKGRGIPTGAGDCCGPKLIQYAINNNLTPLGLSEFYFGAENKSATRKHGTFYSSCTANCAPILGFMLCGLRPL